MVRNRIQRHRATKYTRRCCNSPSKQEQHSDYFLQPFSAHHMRHVGNGVASRVSMAEFALHNGAVRVEELPAEDVGGAREGS